MAYIIAEPSPVSEQKTRLAWMPARWIAFTPKKETQYEDGRPGFDSVDQLFIDPVECIDCGACVPVCPVSAIFALDDLPEKWHAYIEKNANYVTSGKFQADTYKAA
jgi:ferredoxin